MKTISIMLFVMMFPGLIAQEPVFLKDFTTSGADAFRYEPEIEGFTVNNQFLFLVDDGRHGEELWRTNGTEAGTQLLKDIFPDEQSSYIKLLAVIDNTLYFSASDDEHGNELWISQGTASGTQLVEDINPGGAGGIGQAAVLNDMLIFTANGPQGTELYRSLGSAASTFLLKDINPNSTAAGIPFSSSARLLTAAGSNIFFAANDGTNGTELWKTNGTGAGTILVKDINPGPGSVNIDQIKTAGNLIYFEVNGLELWRSDGTEEGTFFLADIAETGTSIQFMEAVNGIFYFIVRESNVVRNLWKSDGTAEGTTKVGSDINTREFVLFNDLLFFKGNNKLWRADGLAEVEVSNVNPQGEWAAAGNILYFNANGTGSGNAIWKTDGTTENTTLVKEVTSAGYMDIQHLQAAGDKVYFVAETQEFGNELWASDGTEEGTFMLIDAVPGEDDGFATYYDVSYGVIGDKLLFAGSDKAHGRELWKTDGTIEGTQLVKDINPRSQDIQLSSNPISFNEQVYFMTEAGLWKTDASAENTGLMHELNYASGLNEFNGKMYFTAESGDLSRTIWISDGTAEGTQPLFDTLSGTNNLFLFQQNLPKMNGILFFMGRNSEYGFELWKTDGTAEGTAMVKDINPGEESSLNSFGDNSYVVTGGTLYFSADDGISGNELWKSDGTSDGTVPVSDINPFGSSACNFFCAFNGAVYFSATDGTAGRELWRTDGTTEGTYLVRDINPDSGNGLSFDSFIAFNDMLYFPATDGVFGKELWRSDGTEAGTTMVKDIYPDQDAFSRSSNPRNFTLFGNSLLFIANTSDGSTIWKTDGTEEGTQPAMELEVTSATGLYATGNQLFFVVNDGEQGLELWRAEAGPDNPVTVKDIISGSRGSQPIIHGYHSGSLYFTAIDDLHGRELWTLSPYDIQVSIGAETGGLCDPGDTITFVAEVMHADNPVTYEWYLNDLLVENEDGEVYASAGFSDGDEVKTLIIAGIGTWVVKDSIFSGSVEINFSIPLAELVVSGNTLTANEGAEYQWFLDGAPLPDISRSITINQSGAYQVEVTNEIGCSSLSDEITLIISSTENEILAGNVRLYPNPVTTHLFIDSGIQEQFIVQIFDIKGKLITREVINPLEDCGITMPGSMPAGMYVIRIQGEKNVIQHKFIKQ
jgi:ELWxxDGT repeat protein